MITGLVHFSPSGKFKMSNKPICDHAWENYFDSLVHIKIFKENPCFDFRLSKHELSLKISGFKCNIKRSCQLKGYCM